MNTLRLNILGFPAINRDLDVDILDPASNTVVRTVKPFLDGTAKIPRINPGSYELRLRHPNLALPVLRRRFRVLPTGDTKVSVLIDPSQFRETPIRDIPDANLTPVRGSVESVAETLLPLGDKQPGEAIKAEDWNALASGVRDIALAIAELTRLVSPLGHNHPELEEKFDEVSGNFRTLLETLSAALTELQRQIQSLRFRKVVENVLDDASIDRTSSRGIELLDLIRTLEAEATKTPTEFSRTARNVGQQLFTKVEQLKDENRDNPQFLDSQNVKTLEDSLDLLRFQRTTNYVTELSQYRKVDRQLGGAAVKFFGS